MDGRDVIREIRKQEVAAGVERKSKIIVTAANTDMEGITSALLGRCNA